MEDVYIFYRKLYYVKGCVKVTETAAGCEAASIARVYRYMKVTLIVLLWHARVTLLVKQIC